jgi:hypothetical protein
MAGLDGEEAGVVGDDAERRRQLDSFAWHRRRLQRWPDSFGTRWRPLIELGCFRGKKKRARLGSGAAVVCSSTASKGPFYRHGRARELGFRKVVWRENFQGAAALSMTSGHGGGSWVTRLLRARAGIARWPLQRSPRVRSGR